MSYTINIIDFLGGERMEILLAALLLLWGNITDSNPEISMEQLIQASLDTRDAIIQQAAGPPRDEQSVNSTEWVKKDPQLGEAPIVRGLFATSHSAGGARLETLIDLINATELNALVIDV